MNVHHTLRGVKMFQSLDEQARLLIEKKCLWRNCERDSQIIRHQDGSDDIVFIATGRARVNIYSANGRVVTFRDIGPGDFVGEMSAIDGQARSASIEALDDCIVAYLSSEAFWHLMESSPDVMRMMLLHLCRQVRSLTDRVYEFSTLAVRNRIQAELLRLSRVEAGDSNCARISPAPTHAELASRVATHREAVTRELRRLTKLGVIEKRNRNLVILDIDRLAGMVEDITDL